MSEYGKQGRFRWTFTIWLIAFVAAAGTVLWLVGS